MKPINNANRHDWWWIIEDCELSSPVPGDAFASAGLNDRSEKIAQPASALEIAYRLAMLPFEQIRLGQTE